MNQQDETQTTSTPLPVNDPVTTSNQDQALVSGVLDSSPLSPQSSTTDIPEVSESAPPVVPTPSEPSTDVPQPLEQMDTDSVTPGIQAPAMSIPLEPLSSETPESITTIPMPVTPIASVPPPSESDAETMSVAQPTITENIEPAGLVPPVSDLTAADPDLASPVLPTLSMPPVSEINEMPSSSETPPADQVDPEVPQAAVVAPDALGAFAQPAVPLMTTPPTMTESEPVAEQAEEIEPAKTPEPIVIESKVSEVADPLPAPLTPPAIKTTPSSASPSPNPTSAPVDAVMSSPATEPLDKPARQTTPIMVKGAGKYQVRVINEKCIGAASCVAVAPKAFKLNEQQIAEVLASASEESDENLLLAAQSCPTMAIEIIDSETGKKVWPR